MLTNHFCKETVTYYSGNPLDRLSYLREDKQFIELALTHKSTKFLPIRNLNPKLTRTESGAAQFDYMTIDQVTPFLADCPHIFLGVDRSDTTSGRLEHERVTGVAYWAIDLTAKSVADEESFQSVYIVVKLSSFESAIYAQARPVLDWINRNKFCAACGSRTRPDHAGYHLICETEDCPTKKGISNISFPRTDASIIVAVLDYKGENILLGRGKRFPPKMYSCLAGFLEPGESLEDCVRREVQEEAGVKVGHVTIHSSQPWPYPANIMVGCLGQIADASPESHQINLGNDPELADAQWVPIDKVRKLCGLRGKMGESDMWLPPPNAIAWVLLDSLSRLATPKV